MSKYGIPYKGSKAKIVEKFLHLFPSAENFYDLFGGGFSVTHALLQKRPNDFKNFHFNEIDLLINPLIKKAINGEYNYENFKPEFIDRETFFKLKDADGYIKYIWSFGNNGRDYLFSKNIEQYKKSLHNAVVFGIFDSLASEILQLDKWQNDFDDIKARRLFLRKKITSYRKTNIPTMLHQFLSSGQIQQLKQGQQLKQLELLQQLQQLERLEQLQQLDLLKGKRYILHLYNLSYEQVEIRPNSIIYCDIPYKNTNKYGTDFNYEKFFNWADNVKVPVFISEYNNDDCRFTEIFSLEKIKLMNSASNEKAVEKIYVNKAGLEILKNK